jgi:hypothetical protein
VAIYRFRDGKVGAITEYHIPKVLEQARAATAALVQQ